MRVNGNFVRYEPLERDFTDDDRCRLKRNSTEFLYVRAGDMAAISDYLERNLMEMLERDDLGGIVKGHILYQTVVNHVIDVFETPELVTSRDCHRWLIHLMLLHQYTTTAKRMLASLRTVVGLNHYMFGHSVQVAALNLLVQGNLFTLSLDEMVDVGIGALFHDIGMALISGGVLDRPDVSCGAESCRLKHHARQGYEFLRQTGQFSKTTLDIVLHHHERYDGNGYPRGAGGDAIPATAQAAVLCDVYCALTSARHRSHRKRPGMAHADALRVMREEAGNGAYDPELFGRFAEIMDVVLG